MTRSFASRRTALGGLLAALAPFGGAAKPNVKDKPERRKSEGAGPAGASEAARCLGDGQRCGKGSGKRGKKDTPCTGCCSKHASPRSQGPQRCACKPDKMACANNAQCCGGRCIGGQCGPCKPGQLLCKPVGCVEIASDDEHCGRCWNACSADQGCVGGRCTCTAKRCPVGCCDGDQCRPGTADGACGAGGTACAVCAPGQFCNGQTCTCGGASCAGCCDGVTCRTGESDANCGRNGGICEACTGTGVTCGGGGQAGVCGCTPEPVGTTCANKCGMVRNNCGDEIDCTTVCTGCCNGSACLAGNADVNCGRNGETCRACTGAETCGGGNPGTPGICGCTAESAATTCTGKCGVVANNCGQGVNCTLLCAGCCDGGTCLAGTADNACGRNGVACGICPAGADTCCNRGCVDTETDEANCGSCGNACAGGEVCTGGVCRCTPASCPSGCCDGDRCRNGTTTQFCGAGGGICIACTGGDSCCAADCVNTQTDEANCGACGNVCNPARTCEGGQCACPAGTTCPKNYVLQADCTCACPAGFDEVNGGCFLICNNSSLCRGTNCTCAGSMVGSGNYLCINYATGFDQGCTSNLNCPTGTACNSGAYCRPPC